MENIRLIIWDMDDTFWNGTLSEGNIDIPDNRYSIIKTLSKRGIINSISSKNDFEKVKEILEKNNLWDFFVFPHINWNSKGNQIKEIIESIKLRPQTVLFIDDNVNNRNEVSFYNPGIEIADPSIIDSLLTDEHFIGKNDEKLSRLKQYKILEKKKFDEGKFSNNEDFLRQSGIQVRIINNVETEIDRIYELNQRTNQLNFTKNRCSLNELQILISDKTYQKGCVSVKDKYGDYGIVGFFICKENLLKHFYFSCRTIGLGIEQWVYSYLNFPKIEVVGDTATHLKIGFTPDWINKDSDDIVSKEMVCDKRILLLGGCDLEQTAFYLSQKITNLKTQFNYNAKNKYVCHPECTEILRQSVELSKELKEEIISTCPFYDEKIFTNNLFLDEYDYVIYSPLIDTSIGIYSNIENQDIKVFYGNSDFPNLRGHSYMDEETQKNFLELYKFEGRISLDRFYQNLVWIKSKMPSHTKLILINGSTVNIQHPYEPDRFLVHREFNEKIEEFCKNSDNTILLDINAIITTVNDHTDNIRHYTREKYFEISNEILKIIDGNIEIPNYFNIQKNSISLNKEIKKILRKLHLLKFAYKIKEYLEKE